LEEIIIMGKNKYGKGYKAKGQNLKGSQREKGDPIKGGKMKASHILVGKFTKAQEIYEDIQAGQDFEQLAQQYSTCPSRKRGGNLGAFGKGDMVPEFWNATAKLKIGEISNPVKSTYGYHIIKRTA
jgi:peptidyl-prolyl cis-trans isomerase C